MSIKFRLKIGGEETITKKGLFQDSVLSPTLFNVFVNDLLILFYTNGIEIRAYADDIVWIWSSITQIQKAIIIMDQW